MKLKIELTRKHVTHYQPLSATCNTGKTAPYTTFLKNNQQSTGAASNPSVFNLH